MKGRRRLIIAVGCLVGGFLVVIAGALALIESEEVVVLHTRDHAGENYRSRIWVVDREGSQWIAPGNRSNAWFQRLVADPQVGLERGEQHDCFTAIVVEAPDAIPILEDLLEKYAAVLHGPALLNRLLDPDGDDTPPVAVRLDPREGPCYSG